MQLRRLAVPALVPTAFLLGTFVNTGFTQQGAMPDPVVVSVAFMKVDPAKDEEYRRLEREIWRPIHQERIRQGLMRSWTVYAVRFPSGSKRDYDYAIVNTHKSVADMERSIMDVVQKVHPNTPWAELVRRTVAARDQVRGEMWYQIDHIQ
jgi:L-rhamnose mutarotase